MALHVEVFTDPTCPWAYSAEPARLRLEWLYGDQLALRSRMIVLSEDPAEMEAKGFSPALLARFSRTIQADHGMPIELAERSRLAASVLACRAVVAARLHAPGAEAAVLRELRIAALGTTALVDEREVVLAAGERAGVARDDLDAWLEDPAVEAALRDDVEAARTPGAAARALDHKLADATDGRRRYTAPSWVVHTPDGRLLEAPGFQPAAAYEALVANADPSLERRAEPADVEEVLRWADTPLATAEVAVLLGIDREEARTRLAGAAEPQPVGEDAFWSLAPVAA